MDIDETVDGANTGEMPDVQAATFAPIDQGTAESAPRSLDLILDLMLEATVELGRCKMQIREILALGPGSVVELNKLAGEPADLCINGKTLARGEVVVIDDSFGIRITEIVTPAERLESLR